MTNEQSIMEHIYELEQELALAKSTIKFNKYNFNVEKALKACLIMTRNFNYTDYNPYLIKCFEECNVDTQSEDFNTSIIWTTMKWASKDRANECRAEYFIEKIIEGLKIVKVEDKWPLIRKVTNLYLQEIENEKEYQTGE
jgi:hypothetical protein